MTQEITLTKQQVLKEASGKLEILLNQNIKAMPKGFNETRFLQNCITVLQDTKDIEKCSSISIARCMIKAAYLGLDFFQKECYPIPYQVWENRKPTGKYELNFQTDYKGEVKLCRKYSVFEIQDIYADVVREGDIFEIEIKEGKQLVNFRPVMFNDKDIMGAFAVVVYKNGGMNYVAMSLKEIMHIRNTYSKAPDSPAWKNSEGEMFKKVAIRRLKKMVNLEFDNAEQDKAWEDGAVTTMDETKQVVNTEIEDPFKKNQTPQIEEAQVKPVPEIPPPHEKPPFDEEGCRKDLKLKHPNYDETYIEHLVKEAKAKW